MDEKAEAKRLAKKAKFDKAAQVVAERKRKAKLARDLDTVKALKKAVTKREHAIVAKQQAVERMQTQIANIEAKLAEAS